jgi:hypothetical protein
MNFGLEFLKAEETICLLHKVQQCSDHLFRPPIFLTKWLARDIFEVAVTRQFSVDVKNKWRHTSIYPHVFIA